MADLRQRLVAFYQRHNPTNLAQIDAILTAWGHKESELWRQMAKKYGQRAVDDMAPKAPMPTSTVPGPHKPTASPTPTATTPVPEDSELDSDDEPIGNLVKDQGRLPPTPHDANEPSLGRWVHDDASGLEGLVIGVKAGGWRVVLSVGGNSVNQRSGALEYAAGEPPAELVNTCQQDYNVPYAPATEAMRKKVLSRRPQLVEDAEEAKEENDEKDDLGTGSPRSGRRCFKKFAPPYPRFWGVSWGFKKKQWAAYYYGVNPNKIICIGYFDDDVEAALAVRKVPTLRGTRLRYDVVFVSTPSTRCITQC